MWIFDVAMNTWIRARSAWRTASHAAVDVLEPGARQAGDDRAPHGLGDRLDRVEVTVGRDREAGLDHVDPQPGELLRDLELLGDVEGDAGRLLAVSQCRVEDLHGFHVALPGAVGVRCANEKPSGQWHGGSSASTYVCSRLCKEEAQQR